MKKKVISMLLAVSMISTSPIYAAEFSDGNSVVVNDADTVNGTDADSADSAEIPDTTLFSSDTVNGAGDVNDSVDAGGDSAENAFSDQKVPDVDDGSGSGVDAAEVNVAPNGVYDYKSDLTSYKINAVDRAVSQIISEAGITSQNTDLEKISMIMAWFKENTSYSNEKEMGNQDPYGSLVLRRAVCGGFATGLSTVLTKMGITNYVRIGHDIEGNGHGWVEVELNNRFYILDATVRYIPYSFLEDYNGYWFKDIWESNDHTRCANTYSCKGIPASEIEYIGANGNSLYVSTNAGYYVMMV